MKITVDTGKRSAIIFIAVTAVMIAFLIFPLKWYKDNSDNKKGIEVSISGTFYKKGAFEIFLMLPGNKIESNEVIQYSAFDTVQVVKAYFPMPDTAASIVIQFKKHPSDSFIVHNVKFTTPYSANTINISKFPLKGKRNNIIIAPEEINTSTIQSGTKNDFVVVSPVFSYYKIHTDTKRQQNILITIAVIMLIVFYFYKRLNILSYCYLIISSSTFIILSYLFSDINFRSLFHAKSSSVPVLEIGMVIPVDDRLVLYWDFDNSTTSKMSEDRKIQFLVNGAPDLQHFTFQLPNDSVIQRLRLYLGRLPFGNREIHYFRFRKYDKIIDIPLTSLPSFFTVLHNVYQLKSKDGIINVPIKDQNPYLETRNNISEMLQPLYDYNINRLAGYYISLMLSVLLFFWLQFSSISRKLADKQKDFNL